MPIPRFLIISLVIAAISLSCGKETPDPLPPIPAFENQILNDINHYRQMIGLDILKMDSVMLAEARRHSSDMGLKLLDVSHYGFEARAARIHVVLGDGPVAENVARGNVYGQWLISKEDKKNIEGNFNHTGIGIVEGKDGYYYCTQIFLLSFP